MIISKGDKLSCVVCFAVALFYVLWTPHKFIVKDLLYFGSKMSMSPILNPFTNINMRIATPVLLEQGVSGETWITSIGED